MDLVNLIEAKANKQSVSQRKKADYIVSELVASNEERLQIYIREMPQYQVCFIVETMVYKILSEAFDQYTGEDFKYIIAQGFIFELKNLLVEGLMKVAELTPVYQ